ncbi:putative vacuolar membrane transporter for cationic amino acids [Massospora cicadina]|nr:putative vacuolar membrane transporter for cationic amino acids [Massospora cicadina]
MTPQIYANWKLKNASSLSPGYVALSLAGNLLSCTGAILGGLIFTSILVTGYLSLLGFVLLYQIYLYQLPEDDIATTIAWRPTDAIQTFTTRPLSFRRRLSFLPSYEPILPDVDTLKRQSNSGRDWPDLPPNAIQPGSYTEASPLVASSDGVQRDYRYSGASFNSHHTRAASVLSARSSRLSQSITQYLQKNRASILSIRPDSIVSQKAGNPLTRLSVVSTFTYPPTAPPPTSRAQTGAILIGLAAVGVFMTLLVSSSPSPRSILDHLLVPQTLGWMASILFIAGRGAQLHKNYSRRSVEGLSGIMFIISIVGNVNFILALLLYSVEASYLVFNLPWLAGGVFGLLLDLAVVFQFFLYGDNCIPYDALSFDDEAND